MMQEIRLDDKRSILIGEHASVVCRRYKCADCGATILKPVLKKGTAPKRCAPCQEKHVIKKHLTPYFKRRRKQYKENYLRKHPPLGTPQTRGTSLTVKEGHVVAYVELQKHKPSRELKEVD